MNRITDHFQQLRSLFKKIDCKVRRRNIWYVIKRQRCDILDKVPPTDPLEPLWVDPNNVTKHSPVRFERHKYVGSTLSGDWDDPDQSKADLIEKHGNNIEQTPLFTCFCEHFKQNVAWTDTEFVQKQLEIVAHNGVGWYGKCRTEEEIHEYCQYLDGLYNCLSESGLNQQPSVNSSLYNLIFGDYLHGVTININRNGMFLFNGDGRHRLCLSKVLDLDKIPVYVIVRHTIWQNKRAKYHKNREKYDGNISNHPDIH